MEVYYLPARVHPGIGATRSMHRRGCAGDTADCCLQRTLHRRAMTMRLPLEAMIVCAVVLNATRNIHILFMFVWCSKAARLHQCDLRYLRGVALAPPQLGDARVAAMTIDVARRQFVEHFLDYQLIEQRLQDMAPCAQLDHHRLIGGVQRLLGIILVRDNAQQLLTTRLELLFQEFASLGSQRGLLLLRALLV